MPLGGGGHGVASRESWAACSSKEGVHLVVSALSFDHLCDAIFESEKPRDEDWWTGSEQCVQVLLKLFEQWLLWCGVLVSLAIRSAKVRARYDRQALA